MASHDKQDEQGNQEPVLKVNDRRRFDAEGNEKPEGEPWSSDRDGAGADALSDSGARAGEPAARPLPAIDFATFVLSLSTSTMVHLGETPDPDGAQQERNLEMARQTIDILGMLKDKTAGNLTDEERRLLDELLYDLRLRYVAARR